MDIKAISTLSLPESFTTQKQRPKPDSQEINTAVTLTAESDDKSKKSAKKLPYVAAGVVLAGLAIFATRNKLKLSNAKNLKEEASEVITEVKKEIKEEVSSVVKEAKSEVKKAAKNIHEEMRESISRSVLPQYRNETINTMKFTLPEGTIKAAQDSAALKKELPAATQMKEASTLRRQLFLPLPEKPKEKMVCIGFEKGKPVYEKLENLVSQNAEPTASVFTEARKGVNFLNDKVIEKIVKIKTDNASEVNRIIAENTKDGHIDLNMMRKIAHDFASDKAGRGADRFHQAAELLEQSYIREFIKKDGADVKGIFNLHDFMKTDSELFSIYTQMPPEEVANRLNYIRYNDLLRGGVEKDMKPDMFVEKMFDRLVEKLQFKNYNEALKIRV